MTVDETQTAPHDFAPRRWRWWFPIRILCRHCYAPKELHPRTGWVKSRPLDDGTYLGADAPHFQERGW